MESTPACVFEGRHQWGNHPHQGRCFEPDIEAVREGIFLSLHPKTRITSWFTCNDVSIEIDDADPNGECV